MMRCAPSISIVAQSLCMAVILPPENGPQQTGAVQVVQRARWMTSEQGQRIPAEVGGTLSPAAMYELPVRPTVLRPAPLDLPRVPCSLGGRSDTGEGHGHGRLWRGSFPTSPAAFQGAGHRAFASPIGACRSAAAWWGVFLNDFDQFILGSGGDLGWDTLASGGKISSMETDWATIEINGAQRIIHRRPTPAHFALPWRRRAPERYCSQKKKKAHSFLLVISPLVRVRLGDVQSGTRRGRPENPRQSFPS